jgi:serine/threonine-protein kinase PknG
MADTLIAEGAYAAAESEVAAVHAADPFDWRVWWYRGKSLLTQAEQDAHMASGAVSAFDTVYSELPGELAPKLAIALSCEAKGDHDTAMYYYDLVSRTDPNYTSAAFGLARCRLASGDRDGAAEAYCRVPATSSLYTQAQIALTRAMLLTTPKPPGEPELRRASETLAALALDGLTLHRLSADLLLTAIDRLACKGLAANPSCQVLGQALEERALRSSAEKELRSCARYVKTAQERIALVDQANAVRPTTLF